MRVIMHIWVQIFSSGLVQIPVKEGFYNLGDGNWKAVKRSYYLTEYGYRFTIQEIETEEELLWECCNDYMAYPQWIEDPQISSVAELLQIYATN